ncbi:hypothetical protein CR513_52619, partial [Mucuna pruriens]
MCTCCGRICYIVDRCYRKHGFPPGSCFRGSGSNVNYAAGDGDDFERKEEDINSNLDKDQVAPPIFTMMNIRHYFHDIATSSDSFKGMWIINTGASDHICGSLEPFTAYEKIKSVIIKLPDGSDMCPLQFLRKLCNQFSCITANKIGLRDVCHFAKKNGEARHAFELLHMDIWGPFSVPLIHNHRYILPVVNDYSRFSWTVLLKGKYETRVHIQKFVLLMEKQFGAVVKVIRSAIGAEFMLCDFYASKGIHRQTS